MELHKLIIKYRLVYLVIVAVFVWLAIDAWDWYKDNHSEMKEWAVAGFVSIYGTILGVLKFCLEHVRQNTEQD